MFSGCTVLPDSKETELGSSNQEVFLSTGRNTGVVLMSCHAWKCVPTTIFVGVDRRVLCKGHKNYFYD